MRAFKVDDLVTIAEENLQVRVLAMAWQDEGPAYWVQDARNRVRVVFHEELERTENRG